MQKLDGEKFRAVLEAIAAEKTKRRKSAATRPRVSPSVGTLMPTADVDVLLLDRPGLDS